ncbi:MAG: hypothetical protein JOZ59_06135 [Candidatus Eremiobacteraeota bacterium]|nr:hypothetical protein [Candidatus Eremiobacteraeota bacterium]
MLIASGSFARADQGPVWWVVQQNIQQQQAQAAVQNELARQQISQGLQRQLDLQSVNLQAQAGAMETQRALNALQVRNALDQQVQDFRYIQNLQLLQIQQAEINAALYGLQKKASAKKAVRKTSPRG